MTAADMLDERSVAQPRVAARLGRVPFLTLVFFLLPAFLLYLLFVLYPVAQSVRFSLYRWNGLTELTDFVGLDNFIRAFNDPAFVNAMGHNAIIVVLSLVLQLPVALALAVLLNQKLKGRGLLRALFFAPYVLSEVVAGVVWRQIYRPGGLLDQVLIGLGAENTSYEWLANPDIVLYSLFFVISWKYFGFHMVLMLAGLQQIPDELKEAAAIDGGSNWKIFRHITFPLLGPTIRVSMFLSIVGALQLFDLVWVTTKGGPIGASSTMATFLYEQFLKNLWGYASAVSMIIFLLSLLFAVLYQRAALRRYLEGSSHA
jgi:raffinose/stachyose/melibiose transport system permease protein